MRSSIVLLGLMALACLMIPAYAEVDPQEFVDQTKMELMNNQILGERGIDTGSYRGQPWATSSLNDSNKETTSVETVSGVQVPSGIGLSSDYMSKTDSFLKDAMSNGYYVLSIPEFVNRSVADKNWVVVDTRPAQLYAAGHIAGALNIVKEDLISQMGMIPAGQKVAVYDALDAIAAFAVQTLRTYGDREAFILSGGIDAWRAAGLPVVT
jgi:rhodanese-related sulfurtransferase